MPWRRVDDSESLGQLRKAKLYADEDVEEEVVGALRIAGVNITSARELGHRGKPDSFHAALSFKEKRFLLTKNARDFLDDHKLPWHRTFGVIAIAGDLGSRKEEYGAAAYRLISMIVPFGERFEHMKIQLSGDGARLRYLGRDGRVYEERYRFEGDDVYTWAE